MHGVASLLAAAAAAHALARLLRVPAIPLLTLSGVALAWIEPLSASVIQDALVLGVAFLLFSSGLELSPRRARAQRGAALRVGIVQFLALGALGWGAAGLLGYGPVEAAYVALALTASSTLVGVRTLQRRGQAFEPFGRLVLGVLLLQDLLVLVAVAVVGGLSDGWAAGFAALAAVTGLGVLALGARRWIAPLLAGVEDEEELVLLGALGLLFGFVGLASLLDVPLVAGAFMAGIGLSSFPADGIVRSKLAPIGDFFSAVFFTALGALVRVPSTTEILHAAAFTAVVLGSTVPLVAWIAARHGFSSRSAIEAGLLLSQTSEISLVLGLSGMFLGHIGAGTFTAIALTTMVTMLLTPLVATDRMALRLTRLFAARSGSGAEPPAGHVLVLGAGATGAPLLEDLIVSGCPVVVVDEDPAIIRELGAAGLVAIRGDASDPLVIERAGAARARICVSTVRRPRDNAALLAAARPGSVLVRVFDEEDAAWVRERGGRPVSFPEATARAFLEWYDAAAAFLDERLAARTGSEASRSDAG